MPRLLVVHHSPTPAPRALTERVVAGAHDDAIEGVEVEVVTALDADLASAERADGFLLGTSANFGYMSGALKHFFDRFFLRLGGALADDGRVLPPPAAAALRAAGSTAATTRPVRSVRSRPSRVRCRGGRRPRCSRCSATWARRSSPRRTSSDGTIAALLAD